MFRTSLLAFAVGVVCTAASAQEVDVPQFAENVTLHVVAHEMGHALIREFDLPVLTSEEGMADDFATLIILQALPERAPAIIEDRARSLLLERDEPGPFAEHDSDVRRAGRMLCLAVGLVPDAFDALATELEMSAEARDQCRDFAPEIARSWRRIAAPFLLPADVPVNEAGLRFDEAPIPASISDSELAELSFALLSRFDWHSFITLHFADCDRTARWQRNGRTITICDAYVQRFADQAQTLGEG